MGELGGQDLFVWVLNRANLFPRISHAKKCYLKFFSITPGSQTHGYRSTGVHVTLRIITTLTYLPALLSSQPVHLHSVACSLMLCTAAAPGSLFGWHLHKLVAMSSWDTQKMWSQNKTSTKRHRSWLGFLYSSNCKGVDYQPKPGIYRYL